MKDGTLKRPMRVYADTSVFGGTYDKEFEEASTAFFDLVRASKFRLVVSTVVLDELVTVPDAVRSFFTEMLGYIDVLEPSDEADLRTRTTSKPFRRPITVYASVPKPKDVQRNQFMPLPDDSEAVATWRRRMGTSEAQEIYKERASTAECVNAIARNRGLRQFTVRGLRKIKAVVLWYILAHNLMRAHHLRLAAA